MTEFNTKKNINHSSSICSAVCDLTPPCRTKVMEQALLISENGDYEKSRFTDEHIIGFLITSP